MEHLTQLKELILCFFGHVGKGNTYNNDTETFAKVGSVNAELGEYKNIMSPVMIGAKKLQELFNYLVMIMIMIALSKEPAPTDLT